MNVVNITLQVTLDEAQAIQNALEMGTSQLKDEDVMIDVLEDIAAEIGIAIGPSSDEHSIHYASQAACPPL